MNAFFIIFQSPDCEVSMLKPMDVSNPPIKHTSLANEGYLDGLRRGWMAFPKLQIKDSYPQGLCLGSLKVFALLSYQPLYLRSLPEMEPDLGCPLPYHSISTIKSAQ